METCDRCGLPIKYCICEFLKYEQQKRKSILKRLFKKEEEDDDFRYCFLCYDYHYPGCHKKLEVENG